VWTHLAIRVTRRCSRGREVSMPEFRVIALLRKILVILTDGRLPFDVRCVRAKAVIDDSLTELRADDQAQFVRDAVEPRREVNGDIILA